MALEPLTLDIILQLFYISVALVILGIVLNWLLGLKPEVMKELRNTARNLQERLKQAQILGDEQLMVQLQSETMLMMKQMLKKQIAPMLIRCVIFLGIFGLLSFYYGKYEFWYWIYFLFSLLLSLLVFGIRKAYKKITGKETKREAFAKEILGTISPTQHLTQDINMAKPVQNNSSIVPQIEEGDIKQDRENSSKPSQSQTETDSWKNRLKN